MPTVAQWPEETHSHLSNVLAETHESYRALLISAYIKTTCGDIHILSNKFSWHDVLLKNKKNLCFTLIT